MGNIGKEVLTHSTISTRETRKQHQLYALNIFLLLTLLALFLLGFNRIIDDGNDVVRSTFTLPGTVPVSVLEMRPRTQTSLVAVGVHGYAGSKELMSNFGVELARAGITTYLLDLPGHGQSPTPMHIDAQGNPTEAEEITAVSEVVAYSQRTNQTSLQNTTSSAGIILIGHGLGSRAVADYAGAHNNTVLATILVSPLWQGLPTPALPKNLLLLAGQNDLPTALSTTTRLMQSACGWSHAPQLPATCGNSQDGTARRAVIIPGANYLTILTASATFDTTLNWLQRVTPQFVATIPHNDARMAWFIFAVASILLSILPLSALLAHIFAVKPQVPVVSEWQMLLFQVCLVISIVMAILIQYFWQPFTFLHIQLADYISGYFFIVAFIAVLLLLIVYRKVLFPPFSQVFRQLLLGGVLALFLYCTLGQISTFAWENLSFTLPRLWRFLIIFLLLLPICLLDEGVNRAHLEGGRIRAIVSSFLTRVFLMAGLFVAIQFSAGLNFLNLMLPLLAMVLIILLGFSVQLAISGRAALASALLNALIIAWILAVVFPLT